LKIALSPIIEDVRGSTANITMQQTLAGLTARFRKTPVRPASTAQFAVKAALASISQTWKSAPMGAFRAGWVLLAFNNPYTDVFGTQHKMSGSAFFAKLNKNLNTLGLGIIFPAPVTVSCGNPATISSTHNSTPTSIVLTGVTAGASAVYAYSSYTGPTPANGQSFTATGFTTAGNNVDAQIITAFDPIGQTITVALTTQVTETSAATGTIPASFIVTATTQPTSQEAVVIRATKPLSPGILSIGNTQTIIQTFPAGTHSPWDISAAYAKKNTTINAGFLIYFEVNYVNTVTGYAGTLIIDSLNW
jgi:hypothetical protein